MSSKKILLVEDNSDDEKMALRVLQKSGLNASVVVARDGVEALEFLFATDAARDQGQTLDLVLLDLKLPRLDGYGVLSRIRADARTRYLPVVILTSSDEPKDLTRSYELGVNSYVQKPVGFHEYGEIVGQILRYWLVANKSSPSPTGIVS